MNGIEKLRNVVEWCNNQAEYFNDQFDSIDKLERVFDYAENNNLEFMDNDYLFSDNVTEEERVKALVFISKTVISKKGALLKELKSEVLTMEQQIEELLSTLKNKNLSREDIDSVIKKYSK